VEVHGYSICCAAMIPAYQQVMYGSMLAQKTRCLNPGELIIASADDKNNKSTERFNAKYALDGTIYPKL
jgi:hypothetical protein